MLAEAGDEELNGRPVALKREKLCVRRKMSRQKNTATKNKLITRLAQKAFHLRIFILLTRFNISNALFFSWSVRISIVKVAIISLQFVVSGIFAHFRFFGKEGIKKTSPAGDENFKTLAIVIN